MSKKNKTNSNKDDIDEMPETCQTDPRFQNVNVSRCCFTPYVDYHRCQYLLGKQDASCNIFKDMYTRMCPNAWISTWDRRRENGIFPRNFTTEID